MALLYFTLPLLYFTLLGTGFFWIITLLYLLYYVSSTVRGKVIILKPKDTKNQLLLYLTLLGGVK